MATRHGPGHCRRPRSHLVQYRAMGSLRPECALCDGPASDGTRSALQEAVAGFSAVEVLVAMAILGVALAVGISVARPSLEMRAATAVRSLIMQARAQAIWRGASVGVFETDSGVAFAASSLGSDSSCERSENIATLRLSQFPGVRLVDGIRAGGIYWLPSGGGRSCAGGGVISDTLVLQGQRGSAAIVVSSLGRVRVERVP